MRGRPEQCVDPTRRADHKLRILEVTGTDPDPGSRPMGDRLWLASKQHDLDVVVLRVLQEMRDELATNVTGGSGDGDRLGHGSNVRSPMPVVRYGIRTARCRRACSTCSVHAGLVLAEPQPSVTQVGIAQRD